MQYFYNEKPIKMNSTEMMDERQFPEIKDFTIRIMESDFSGMQLLFYSEKNGVLTSFPWLSDVDETLKKMNMMQIFLGTKENPFSAMNGKVLIYADGDYVYVLQAQDSVDAGFETYFRVKYDTYIGEWETLLTCFKSKLYNREEAMELFGLGDMY